MPRTRVLMLAALLLAPSAIADSTDPVLSDCKGNGIQDALEIGDGHAPDINGNLVPDSCETCQADLGVAGPGNLRLWVCGDDLIEPDSLATIMLEGAVPGTLLFLVMSFTAVPSPFKGGTLVPIPPTIVLAGVPAPTDGRLYFGIGGGGRLPVPIFLQYVGVNGSAFEMSNAVEMIIAFS